MVFLYHDFFYFASLLYFSYIILFVQPFSFETTCSRLAKNIRNLSVQDISSFLIVFETSPYFIHYLNNNITTLILEFENKAVVQYASYASLHLDNMEQNERQRMTDYTNVMKSFDMTFNKTISWSNQKQSFAEVFQNRYS